MDKKSTGIGIVFIVIGIWFYAALCSFEVQEGPDMKKIIVKEGIVRTEHEIASLLASEMDFDISGAYKMGHTTRDVIEFLMKEPHNLSVSFYKGRYYEDRKTVLYIIPFLICVLFVITGAGLIIFKGIRRKS